MKKLILFLAFFIFFTNPTQAAPYFYLEQLSTVFQEQHQHEVHLNVYSDQTVTLAQTVLSFDTTYISPSSIAVTQHCFPSPADPALGYGSQSAPYFYNSSKAVISCGFYNPGYISTDADGDRLATITFETIASGSASLSFDTGTTKFYYIGSSVSPGAMSNETLVISPYVAAAPGTGEDPDIATDTLTTSDLNYVEIGVNSSTTTTTTSTGTTSDVDLSVIPEDNTIPSPGDLPDRERPTPLLMKIFSSEEKSETKESVDEGEVLSAQSLRELLIPGKSSADRTVVLINLISVLTFLLILGILIWKFINIKRMNKIKAQHMSELLMGELAVIESKIGADKEPSKESVKSDIGETIKKISEELKETA